MEQYKSKVYVQVDERECIIHCEGGYTTPDDLTNWKLIDEGTGDKYNLCQTHYFVGGLYTADGIPRYKLVKDKPVQRTAEEIQADRAAIVTPPTETEQLRADVDFIAALTGVELT